MNGYQVDDESMVAVFEPGAPLGDELAPGGSFMIQLAGGGEIQGYFTGTQGLGRGLSAFVDFDISPRLAAFSGGAESFSGTLEIEENPEDEPPISYIQLNGTSVPEPSTLLLLASVAAGLTTRRYCRLRAAKAS